MALRALVDGRAPLAELAVGRSFRSDALRLLPFKRIRRFEFASFEDYLENDPPIRAVGGRGRTLRWCPAGASGSSGRTASRFSSRSCSGTRKVDPHMTTDRSVEVPLVVDALSDVARSLAVDGYRLEVQTLRDQTLTISVVAGENACEECLVPKSVMAAILQSTLQNHLHIEKIELQYPTDYR